MNDGSPAARPAAVDRRTLAALTFEWACIVATMSVCWRWSTLPICILGGVVIATRQHALLMLYHDAVHGLLARSRTLNDALINLTVGVPVLLPVELFRPLHIRHHRRLGGADDPERTILFARQHWRYRALPPFKLIRQVTADLLLLNGVRTLLAWRTETRCWHVARSTWVIGAAWVGALIALLIFSSDLGVLVVTLWLVPLLTLTNLLQKVRSFCEHGRGGETETEEGHDWTFSWRAGVLGRLTLWPYNINRHREHHARPDVPWHRLPSLVDTATPGLDPGLLGSLLLDRRERRHRARSSAR